MFWQNSKAGRLPKARRRRLVPQVQGSELSGKSGKGLCGKHRRLLPHSHESQFLPSLVFPASWPGKRLSTKLRGGQTEVMIAWERSKPFGERLYSTGGRRGSPHTFEGEGDHWKGMESSGNLVFWHECSLTLFLPFGCVPSVCQFLELCQSPEGGFGGGPGQYPHLAPTYAAVNALCIIGTEEAYDVINRYSESQQWQKPRGVPHLLTCTDCCLSCLFPCFSERSFFSICTPWSNLTAPFSCMSEVRWMWGEWGFAQAATSVDSRAHLPLETPSLRNIMGKLPLCPRMTHRMTCQWYIRIIQMWCRCPQVSWSLDLFYVNVKI